MNLKTLIESDIRIQEKLLNRYVLKLRDLPDGGLSYKRINGRICYYRIDEVTGKQYHLSKSKHAIVIQLKFKKYIQKAIRIMEDNIKWQKKLLKHYKAYDAQSIEQELSTAYRDQTLKKYEQQFLKTPEEWAKESYKSNPWYPQYLNQMTSFGLMVRTKSEALIAEMLYDAGIPFRYEPELKLIDRYGKERTYYPDFVIMTPQGKLIYWEHYGLFDDERYRNRFFERTDTYFVNGIVQPYNYIVTMDNREGKLDLKGVHQIIEALLLPYFR